MAGKFDTITIYVRGAGKNGKSRRFRNKKLIGLTVNEASDILAGCNENRIEEVLSVGIDEPCYLNGEEISWSSEDIVLKGGDTISYADP